MPNYQSPGVYVEEVDAGPRPIQGVGTAIAAFVGFTEKGPVNEATLITNWTQFANTFGEFVPGTYLASAVYGYFANGGGRCYVVRIGADTAAAGGPQQLPAGPQAQLGGYQIAALAGVTGEISVEVTEPQGDSPPQDSFALLVKRDGTVEETYPAVVTKRGKDNLINQVKERSRLVTITEASTGSALTRPQPQSVTLTAPPAAAVPATLSTDDYVGDAEQRTGFGGLEAVDDITMVAAPDLMSAYERGAIDMEGMLAVQHAMVTHCDSMGDRIAILDPPPGLSPQQVKTWRKETANFNSKYATLYYPWIKVFDPATSRNIHVPPSGHIAGVWARNDDTRGVHKAPANEILRGAVALQTNITKSEHDLLNPEGVNCIRSFPGRGIKVWGARTLSDDPAWRYLNVRRLFNYLESSILNDTQWVVFEPNDDALWARIRRTISAFLVNEWRKGSLFGLTPDEAFYVKCDRETNPADSIDAGHVICEIGVAPVKPAEFVVFRLAQLSSGTSEVGE